MTSKKFRTQLNIFNDPIKKSHHAASLTTEAWMARNVLEAIEKRGKPGGTNEELARDCDLIPAQVRSALSELKLWGNVRLTEATRNKRKVYVFVKK